MYNFTFHFLHALKLLDFSDMIRYILFKGRYFYGKQYKLKRNDI